MIYLINHKFVSFKYNLYVIFFYGASDFYGFHNILICQEELFNTRKLLECFIFTIVL